MTERRYPPIFQSVPADEFTDREEIISMLVKRAVNTVRDMTLSTSVIGQRRLGKTAVMEQVYNRLFWEQDEVVPIYFNFEAKPTDSNRFAWVYFSNFVRQYVAFRLKDDSLVRAGDRGVRDVVAMTERMPDDPIARLAPGVLRRMLSSDAQEFEKLESAIYLPRQVMEYNRAHWGPETPIFVMLGEFQETLRIHFPDGEPADVVGLYQWAVEGRKCPHFVTGSAIRLINQEVLGTGALFGRFRYLEFPPLEQVYGLELVDRLAHKYGVEIPEEMGGYITSRCGGNPFYIRCVVMQALEQGWDEVASTEAVDNLIAHEISHGQIWRDWGSQLLRYFEEINNYTIAKRVLFHAARYESERIEPEEIATAVGRPVDEVVKVMRQLSFADMLEAKGGPIFFNLKDPILRDYIRAQYWLEVEGESLSEVLDRLLSKYRRLKRKYADLVGRLVEARIEVLLHRSDGRKVAGRLFHVEGEVELPRFEFVFDTVVKPPGGREYQIDLQGRWYEGYEPCAWVVEVKHWKTKVTADVVRKFVEAYRALERETRLARVVPWLVNRGGFTEGAVEVIEEEGIYRSGAAEINELLRMFGIERLLPEGI
jgi:hypothetical protein